MAIRLYNTFSGKKETFKPINPPEVKLYQCGPTVYAEAHIGNLRTYIANDILRRALEYDGFRVNQVMNITDVDDKMIKRSREEKTNLKEIASKYEKVFLSDMEALNILRPASLLRATENIEEMIRLIEKLIKIGAAYKSANGIYFDISKSDNYGRLAKLKIKNSAVSRILKDEYDKENPRDFALWKFRAEEDGEVFFDAPFGAGRPGWHIECSAMAMDALGETLDIHTGGHDLIFPHHTNEIAQSEAATGKTFSRYWLHTGFVNMENDKMSKSLGNVITLSDVVKRNFHPLAFRYLALTLHYRTPMRFSWEALEASQTALLKLVRHFTEFQSESNGGKINNEYAKNFKEFLNDDLDTPRALALAWRLIKDGNVSDSDKIATLLDFDRVLGFNLEKLAEEFKKTIELIPEEIKSLVEEREKARKEKNFKKSDELRKKIEEQGYEIEDELAGFKIKRNKF
ncbi:MAG: cysteine--tRNA ligase [Patescibacteria group bacterium]|nr:cysteine--tRNA ligase [Patescibacteria group bacterium]MDE1988597.1 cysteine--tRNA ligase [Patescibacteria group bacterium]MDE2218344.1 cysteine--tRNA ligase [Patescibacteria group bacterium]